MASRLISPLLALGVGIGSGIWIFKPLLQSYGESTAGTFRPEDDHHSARVPNLPFTDLQPAKDPEGKDLLKAPKDEIPTEEPTRKV
ncbi:uncharacterized protein JCM15063_000935 [Sporobolomyces koalae]|uniref:uncharacterized protein n=1 Tax=Sporobolomyces koalae TaxID=500713 RepID=UPI00317173C0